jgi:putative ABC transport system substrate-binding protein
MRRPDFIKVMAGSAAAWPLAARAQQQPTPVVGFLHSGSQSVWMPFANAFKKGLETSNFVDGHNVRIEYRWANGAIDRLSELAAELVSLKVSVIDASGGGTDSVRAAKAATSTIPIVFTVGTDPVKAGLVSSISHPDGNVTGISILNTETGLKRLELLHELVPNASTVVLLANPKNRNGDLSTAEVETAARGAGLNFQLLTASNEGELNSAFVNLANLRNGILLVAIDPYFLDRSLQITTLAARYLIPAIYYSRVFMNAGGLISYGGDVIDAYRQAGIMVAKILRGARPAELPIQQSVKFELVINLKTAKTLGLNVPPTLLALADEVIE